MYVVSTNVIIIVNVWLARLVKSLAAIAPTYVYSTEQEVWGSKPVAAKRNSGFDCFGG